MNYIIFIANTFLPFVIMAAIFYFMLWRPQKQDQKKRKEFLDSLKRGDKIITIGPLIMMKFVVATAKPFNVPVDVSMNPIMIDGTGMCGGCRLTLNQDGKKVTKFACVDGPDFDGYEIDFDEAMSRGRMYAEFEKHAYEDACNLFKDAK